MSYIYIQYDSTHIYISFFGHICLHTPHTHTHTHTHNLANSMSWLALKFVFRHSSGYHVKLLVSILSDPSFPRPSAGSPESLWLQPHPAVPHWQPAATAQCPGSVRPQVAVLQAGLWEEPTQQPLQVQVSPGHISFLGWTLQVHLNFAECSKAVAYSWLLETELLGGLLHFTWVGSLHFWPVGLLSSNGVHVCVFVVCVCVGGWVSEWVCECACVRACVCVCECVCGVWMCVCVQNGFEVCTTLAYPHIHLVLCHYTHTNMQSRIIWGPWTEGLAMDIALEWPQETQGMESYCILLCWFIPVSYTHLTLPTMAVV